MIVNMDGVLANQPVSHGYEPAEGRLQFTLRVRR
jgi:hypothetical protein